MPKEYFRKLSSTEKAEKQRITSIEEPTLTFSILFYRERKEELVLGHLVKNNSIRKSMMG